MNAGHSTVDARSQSQSMFVWKEDSYAFKIEQGCLALAALPNVQFWTHEAVMDDA